MENVPNTPTVGTLVIKIGSKTYETDVSIEPKKTGSPNSTLIQHFKRNISPKIPTECYALFGKMIGHSEPDIKHAGKCFKQNNRQDAILNLHT